MPFVLIKVFAKEPGANGWPKSGNPTTVLASGLARLTHPMTLSMAYDAAACKLYGSEAKLNLPELQVNNQCPSSSPDSQVAEMVNKSSHVSHNSSSTDTCSSTSPIIGAHDVTPRYINYESIKSSNEILGFNGRTAADDASFEQNEEGKGIYGLSSNLGVSLPLVDDSIWAEAAMSIDFPVMDEDTGVFASTLVDVNGRDALQIPWCM